MRHISGAVSRRTLLTTAGGVAATGVTVGGPPASRSAAAPATFTHPGMLHNWGDLNRARVRVARGDEPWLAGWERLVANRHSSPTWQPSPRATIIRGGDGQNYPVLYNDIHAAYQNALRWRIQGQQAHGDCARDILNAWSSMLTTLTGNADRFLAAGIYGYQFANVAELMRGYPGFDLERFQQMMLDVFYPLNDSFLRNHNDACITNYWANWDLCAMSSILAIGILCDDAARYDQGVSYFKTGAGNGAVRNAIPFVHDGQGLAQWQESGRDQPHSVMGVGLMGAFCEMAWNQGDDLYGYDDNRFLKAAEYVAKYNLGEDVPFPTHTWGTGQDCAHREQTLISSAGRGHLRPVWEILHFHYTRRRRLSVPSISAMAARIRAEGGGGDYGPNSGGFDQLGFGTLAYAK